MYKIVGRWRGRSARCQDKLLKFLWSAMTVHSQTFCATIVLVLLTWASWRERALHISTVQIWLNVPKSTVGRFDRLFYRSVVLGSEILIGKVWGPWHYSRSLDERSLLGKAISWAVILASSFGNTTENLVWYTVDRLVLRIGIILGHRAEKSEGWLQSLLALLWVSCSKGLLAKEQLLWIVANKTFVKSGKSWRAHASVPTPCIFAKVIISAAWMSLLGLWFLHI